MVSRSSGVVTSFVAESAGGQKDGQHQDGPASVFIKSIFLSPIFLSIRMLSLLCQFEPRVGTVNTVLVRIERTLPEQVSQLVCGWS